MNHYTRETFAEIVGISSKFLYEIETGKKGFSANTLYNIATTLGVSCDYIITGNSNVEGMNQRIMELFDESQIRKIESILQIIYEIVKNE